MKADKNPDRELELIPGKVQLTSSLKFFGLDAGSSDGTEISIEFDVPAGMDRKTLRRAMLEEQERLDNLALYAQRLKGAVKDGLFHRRRAVIKENYDKLLGRVGRGDQDLGDPGAGHELESGAQ